MFPDSRRCWLQLSLRLIMGAVPWSIMFLSNWRSFLPFYVFALPGYFDREQVWCHWLSDVLIRRPYVAVDPRESVILVLPFRLFIDSESIGKLWAEFWLMAFPLDPLIAHSNKLVHLCNKSPTASPENMELGPRYHTVGPAWLLGLEGNQ